jgi:hypothetical protein
MKNVYICIGIYLEIDGTNKEHIRLNSPLFWQ